MRLTQDLRPWAASLAKESGRQRRCTPSTNVFYLPFPCSDAALRHHQRHSGQWLKLQLTPGTVETMWCLALTTLEQLVDVPMHWLCECRSDLHMSNGFKHSRSFNWLFAVGLVSYIAAMALIRPCWHSLVVAQGCEDCGAQLKRGSSTCLEAQGEPSFLFPTYMLAITVRVLQPP